MRNHGFRQSADFRISAEKPPIFDEFLHKFRSFHKKRRAFFPAGLIFDDFDAKNADFFKFCEVNKPVRLFKIMLPRGTPPDSYPHRRIELVDKICYYKIESLSTGGALWQTIYWRWRSNSWTSLLPPFPLGLTT
ncbi:hypothetical protein GPK77_05465 [Butyricicoccus faecihominis]|nr:hypothetical protein [Butyricicoccus faecihominis]